MPDRSSDKNLFRLRNVQMFVQRRQKSAEFKPPKGSLFIVMLWEKNQTKAQNNKQTNILNQTISNSLLVDIVTESVILVESLRHHFRSSLPLPPLSHHPNQQRGRPGDGCGSISYRRSQQHPTLLHPDRVSLVCSLYKYSRKSGAYWTFHFGWALQSLDVILGLTFWDLSSQEWRVLAFSQEEIDMAMCCSVFQVCFDQLWVTEIDGRFCAPFHTPREELHNISHLE